MIYLVIHVHILHEVLICCCVMHLWGILKEQCFRHIPHSLEDYLCENIETVLHSITREQCDVMVSRMIDLMELVAHYGGRHVEHSCEIGMQKLKAYKSISVTFGGGSIL